MSDIDFNAGRWALIRGYSGDLSPDMRRITSSTAQLIRSEHANGGYKRQNRKSEVLTTFATRDEAERVLNSIAGIRGECERRMQAARVAASASLEKLLGGSKIDGEVRRG